MRGHVVLNCDFCHGEGCNHGHGHGVVAYGHYIMVMAITIMNCSVQQYFAKKKKKKGR